MLFPSGRMRLALLLLTCTIVSAAEAIEPEHGPAQLQLDLGLFSAVGELGLVLLYAPPASPLRLELGAGLAIPGIPTFEVMPKLNLGSGSWKFTPGLGLAIAFSSPDKPGAHTSSIFQNAYGRSYNLWLNLDLLAAEFTARSGLTFTAALGGSMSLLPLQVCVDGCGPPQVPIVLPQVRIGIGKWM